MREIKFKVWNEEKKQIQFVGAIDWDMNEEVITCNTKNDRLYRYLPEELPIMQYTGFKLYGKEIGSPEVEVYENDVIETKDFISKKTMRYKVEFCSYRGSWVVTQNDGNADIVIMTLRDLIDTIGIDKYVVGNFSVNPELMKGA